MACSKFAAVAFDTVPESIKVGEKTGKPVEVENARLAELWPLVRAALPLEACPLRSGSVTACGDAVQLVAFCAKRNGAPNTLNPKTGSAAVKPHHISTFTRAIIVPQDRMQGNFNLRYLCGILLLTIEINRAYGIVW